MKLFRIIPYIIFSYFFVFTNDGFSQCATDTLPPMCIAPADMQIGIDSFEFYFNKSRFYERDSLKIVNRFGAAEAVDNCTATIIELTPEYPYYFGRCDKKRVHRLFLAIDENGNESKDTCRQLVAADPAKDVEQIIQLPSLYEPFQSFISTDTLTRFGEGHFLLNDWGPSVVGNDTIQDYWVYNLCTPPENSSIRYSYLPLFDIDGDGRKGDAYTMRIANDSLYFERPNLRDSVIAFPNNDWRYTSDQLYSGKQDYEFVGNVFTDLNGNCEQEVIENDIPNFTIIVRSFPSGATFETSTNSSGNYKLTADISLLDTLLEVKYATDLNIIQACRNSLSIKKPVIPARIQHDFAITLVPDCPTIVVDIGAVRLRRCFTNRYFVNYFNYSAEEIEEVNIEVELDPFLLYNHSSISAIDLGDNKYQFLIGTLQSGESGQFYIDVEVSCEAELGQTHCVKAQVFPYIDCATESLTWSGASIQLAAVCEGDSVQFIIENIGDGSMIQESDFVVTEDVLMLRQGSFQLPKQESLTLSYPANGATYRLAADQVVNHPGRSQPSISIEGCGGINTPGLVNAFPQDDQNLNVSIDCQENIGSYDPNDKSAVPSGWGAENYIANNTDIDYKIRFQNTGTDTAFKVVIVDTLSTFLDATTIIPGAASHSYTYQQQLDTSSGVHIIQFTFKDILLPDSTTNLEGSNGFVKFKIAQQPDLLDNTIFENKAAIFFDFNEPIITNTVFHAIGQPSADRIISNTTEILLSNREIIVQPNPFSESTQISISGDPIKQGILRLYNPLGQTTQQQVFSGNQLSLQRNNLQSGFYIYTILSDNQLIATGKMQVNQE